MLKPELQVGDVFFAVTEEGSTRVALYARVDKRKGAKLDIWVINGLWGYTTDLQGNAPKGTLMSNGRPSHCPFIRVLDKPVSKKFYDYNDAMLWADSQLKGVSHGT
ncbi:hypothetical protein V8U11_10990 [Pseudomonas chlororaphis]|uniref:hypothetical protein n=1 Tax=Pseudomonas chlororaphis TaxID=587753 RepID=UPI0030CD2126